jgi:LysE type translocator
VLGFRQGLVSNLANPKIAVFFTSLLPQFVSSREPVLLPFLLLGSLFVAITLVWLCAYALLASKISDSRVRRSGRRLTGSPASCSSASASGSRSSTADGRRACRRASAGSSLRRFRAPQVDCVIYYRI